MTQAFQQGNDPGDESDYREQVEPEDPLAAAKGCVLGTVIGIVLWAAIIATVVKVVCS